MKANRFIALLSCVLLLQNVTIAQDVSYDIELGQQYAQLVEMQMGLYVSAPGNSLVQSEYSFVRYT